MIDWLIDWLIGYSLIKEVTNDMKIGYTRCRRVLMSILVNSLLKPSSPVTVFTPWPLLKTCIFYRNDKILHVELCFCWTMMQMYLKGRTLLLCSCMNIVFSNLDLRVTKPIMTWMNIVCLSFWFLPSPLINNLSALIVVRLLFQEYDYIVVKRHIL